MGGDIGEIKLGSERELYKYINHYVAVKRGKNIYIYILVQVNIIFALPDYSSGVIEVETPKIISSVHWEIFHQLAHTGREQYCACR